MAFGVRWVAPILPDFFRLYPDIAVDLHLSDDKVDLIGEGFDAALRIAVLEDSSLLVRQLAPGRRFILAAPSYLALRASATPRRSRGPSLPGLRLSGPEAMPGASRTRTARVRRSRRWGPCG
jgi:DNA-binding transcriptional LysR family regulator